MQCWIFHKWGKWEQFTWVGTIQYAWRKGDPVPASENWERRKCELCGHVQEKRIS